VIIQILTPELSAYADKMRKVMRQTEIILFPIVLVKVFPEPLERLVDTEIAGGGDSDCKEGLQRQGGLLHGIGLQ